MDEKKKLWQILLSKSEVNDNGCLIWKGNINRGQGIYSKKSVTRLSFWIHNEKLEKYEDIPKTTNINQGLSINHKCKCEEICIEPKHLYLAITNTTKEYKIPDKIPTELSTSLWTDEMYNLGKEFLDRFGKYDTEVTSEFVETPCRLWTGRIDKNGYGEIQVKGKKKEITYICMRNKK